MSSLSNVWENARAWWQTAAPATRAAATAALLLLVVGLIVAARLSTSPDYTPAFPGVSPKEADAIKKVLDEKGIPSVVADTGDTVSVPSKNAGEAKIAVAGANILDKDTQPSGIESLDKIGMGTSTAVENERIRAADQGELARDLETLDAVQTASVTISPTSDSSLFGAATSATASVILSLKSGQTLDSDQVKGVVNLVAHAVPGLSAKDVTLTDQSGAPLWRDNGAGGNALGDGQPLDENAKFSEAERVKLQGLLDTTLGPRKALVTVNAELNFDQSQVHSVEHLPTPGGTTGTPLSVQEQKESLSGAGAAGRVGGVAGAGGNLNPPSYPAAGSGGGGGDGAYKSTKTTTNYSENTQDTVTQKAPGAINRLTVAALVDSSVSATDAATLLRTLNSAVGVTPGDTSRLVTVQQITFDTSAQKLIQAGVQAAQTQQLLGTVARAVAAVAAAGALLLLLTRAGRRADGPQLALAGEGAHIGLLGREFDAPRAGEMGGGPGAGEMEERPLRIEDVLAEMPEVMSRPRRRAQAQAIEEQQDLKLESVQEMVSVNPGAVALLLKGWMASEARVS